MTAFFRDHRPDLYVYGLVAWTHAEGAVALFEQTRAWLRRERVLLPGSAC
jgi:hypothetical protein